MAFSAPVPILRSFDEKKAKEFYVDFLGFEIVFEHRFGPDAPLYMELRLGDCVIHLSEHHGDAAPGTALRVTGRNLDEFMQGLRDKKYQNANPGNPEKKPWGLREVGIADPFGNRIVFVEEPE